MYCTVYVNGEHYNEDGSFGAEGQQKTFNSKKEAQAFIDSIYKWGDSYKIVKEA